MIKKYALIGMAMLLALGVVGTAIYFYRNYTKTQEELAQLKENPQIMEQERNADLIREVSKLIVLPSDETPTIATVSDLEKLKGQEFFAKAKVGDKVLIYTKAMKAILYDPVNRILVEVAPLNVGGTP